MTCVEVACPYCCTLAVLVDGKEIYPHRPDLAHLPFWLCAPCSAYVGCHPGTQRPLGRLANRELRQWKQRAHAAFDPLWKPGPMKKFKKRWQAYAWLAHAMQISTQECHIGMFDIARCKRAIHHSDALRSTQ